MPVFNPERKFDPYQACRILFRNESILQACSSVAEQGYKYKAGRQSKVDGFRRQLSIDLKSI